MYHTNCLKLIKMVKMVNHCEDHVIFQDVENRIQGNFLYYCLLHSFFMKSSLNWDVWSTQYKPFTGKLCGIALRYKLFGSWYLRYDYSFFLSWSFMYLLLVFRYQWITWHILPLMFFCTINNMCISASSCNSTFFLF